MQKLFSVALVSLLLSGCATMGSTPTGSTPPDTVAQWNRYSILARAATQIGVLKVLEKNPTYAGRVRVIAAEVEKEVAAKDNPLPIDAAISTARGLIRWEKLKVEEVILVDALLETVRMELTRASEGVETSEGMTVAVLDVARWVRETVDLYERTQPRQ